MGIRSGTVLHMTNACTYTGDTRPCSAVPVALNLCNTHYQRLRRRGDPELTRRKREKLEARDKTCSAVSVRGKKCHRTSAHRNGLCSKHNLRLLTHGDTRIARKSRSMDTVAAETLRQEHRNGRSVEALALRAGLPTEYVRDIIEGRTWMEE